MILRPFFKHYGAKYQLSSLLPAPRYKHIVEPFAGSACYSLLYGAGRDVTLCEIDPQTAAIWRWLVAAAPSDVLALPGKLEEIEDVRTIDAPEPARWLVQRWMTPQGSRSNFRAPPSALALAATAGHETSFWGVGIRQRVASQLPHIRHWRIVEGHWEDVCAGEATYIFDPPYQHNKGSTCGVYGKGAALPDFGRLAAVVRSLPGQIIVHEQEGADWLPFWGLKGDAMTGRASTVAGRKRRHEVVWMNNKEESGMYGVQASLFGAAR